ncbi:hypothetical protein KKA77_02785 [Patescibacteria group bacterium]|nr:hypothetical protein [Patescibacteria group bacterium]MBU1783483.1 hypothetical protein [Patescibacteria group bacterium]MBU2081316.1 hypothetical protein [Patescibacteria group bacterium]MBU2214657.1 hypothetical protein [Patescibacteria group bacterium]MBU2250224.1 hypothetical protein [Patescibacteria group bacterium]
MAEQQYPESTCGALIFNPAGKIFLIKSHKWKDKYSRIDKFFKEGNNNIILLMLNLIRKLDK